MSRKRNEYLEASDDEDVSIQSEEQDLYDSRFSRANVKRRRLDDDEELSDFSVADEEKDNHNKILSGDGHDNAADEDAHQPTQPTVPGATKLKPLTPTQLAASQRKARKTGVIYLSRIPPFMKPATLRHLLSPYGTISRLFLTPEAPASYTKRVKAGGNKKRSFIDGWVEFASKKNAKICAETLNGNIIGGKKGGFYHDDIWNIKYLRGFKWNDLMEQVQGEERTREGRLRAEIQRETRERNAFLGNVEMAKKERGIEAKRGRKSNVQKQDEDAKVGDDMVGPSVEQTLAPKKNKRFEQTFRQNEVKVKGSQATEHAEDVKRVLSKIF